MFSTQLLVIHVLHSSKSFVSVNQRNVDVVGLTGTRMFIPTRNTSPLTSTLLQSPRKVVLVYNYFILFNFVTKYFKGDEEQISRNYVFKFLFCYCTHTGIQVIWDEQQSFSLI